MGTDQERSVISAGALPARVREFELKLDQLKLAYEQYFLGMEKREPIQQQQEVMRLMRFLDQQFISNTALRYRYQGLIARLNTYKNYWTRTLRSIEAGTYHRDVARVKRKLAREGIAMPDLRKLRSAAEIERAMRDVAEKRERKPASAIRGRSADDLKKQLDPSDAPAAPAPAQSEQLSGDFDAQLDDVFDSLVAAPPSGPEANHPIANHPTANHPAGDRPAATTPAPTEKPPAKRPKPAASKAAPKKGGELPPGFSREQMDSLYRRFVKAKKMCGEDPASVRYDSLVRSISRQLPKIRGGDDSKHVNFQVVIRNGRAILKAKR